VPEAVGGQVSVGGQVLHFANATGHAMRNERPDAFHLFEPSILIPQKLFQLA